VGGAAPLRGGEVAGVEVGASYCGSRVTGVGQRGRERHGELNGKEETMNPWAERGERRGEGLRRTGGAPARHSSDEEGV
jgi:hypothetical protein